MKVKRIIEIEEDTLKFVQELTEIIIPARSGKTLQKNVIEAIKFSTPYNPTGDLISRSALRNHWKNRILTDCSYISSDEILESIDDAPTVEARPKGKQDRQTGEWIRGFIDALDKAFSLFDANSTYRGERVLQILEKLKWLEKLKAEKGGAENGTDNQD